MLLGDMSGRVPIDPDAWAWANAVGTVTDARFLLVNQLLSDLRVFGGLEKTDDIALLVAENTTQALVTLKGRRTMSPVSSPSFTADRGYAFDGAASYIDTGWIEATHALAMTATSRRLDVYRRTNPTGAFDHGVTDGTRSLIVRPRQASGYRLSMNSGMTVAGAAASVGLSSGQREADDTGSHYYNGAALSTGTALSSPVSGQITGRSLLLGANNNNGMPAGHSSVTLGLAAWGARLTAGEQAGQYAAVQAFMTAVGANV